MKSLKNVLAALAFVIGIGAAFATIGNRNSDNVAETAYKPDQEGVCNIQVTCDVNNTGISCDNYAAVEDDCDQKPTQGLFEQP